MSTIKIDSQSIIRHSQSQRTLKLLTSQRATRKEAISIENRPLSKNSSNETLNEYLKPTLTP